MNKNRAYLLTAFAVILLIPTLIIFITSNHQPTNPTDIEARASSPTLAPTQQEIQAAYQAATYKNTESGYTVKIPRDWDIVESPAANTYTTRVLFTPKNTSLPVGTLSAVNITVIDNAPQTQRMSTQQEFDTWYGRTTNATEGTLSKLANTSIAGQSAVMLADATATNPGWSVVAWTRKGIANYYINIKGNDSYTDTEASIVDYLLSTITIYK